MFSDIQNLGTFFSEVFNKRKRKSAEKREIGSLKSRNVFLQYSKTLTPFLPDMYITLNLETALPGQLSGKASTYTAKGHKFNLLSSYTKHVKNGAR